MELMVHHKLEKCGSIIKNNLKFVKDNSGKSTSTHKNRIIPSRHIPNLLKNHAG